MRFLQEADDMVLQKRWDLAAVGELVNITNV